MKNSIKILTSKCCKYITLKNIFEIAFVSLTIPKNYLHQFFVVHIYIIHT